MEYLIRIFQNKGFRRILILASVALLLYFMKSMLDMFLLNFIFIYLMYSMQNFITRNLKNRVHVHQRLITAILYLLLAGIITLVFYKFVPVIITQCAQLAKLIQGFYIHPHENPIINYLVDATKQINLEEYAQQGIEYIYKSVTNIGKWGLNILIALILSLFFLLEKNKIVRFTTKFKKSKIAFIYDEIEYFGSKFLHSFGKVIETQILIAMINAALSIVALSIMGFPHVLALGIMIFVFGLVPVAGVLVSLIPLSIIAFSVGGITKLVYMLIMIAVLHALESYILNPKLMSSKTNLPVFYTFIVLIVSEHLLGVWGLIIGIPIFMFILDILEVNFRETTE